MTIVDGDKKGVERVRHVMAGAFDATFIGSVDQLRAKQLGARVIDLATFPMIEGVTLTTTTTYVNNHPEEVDALLRSLVDALHYFKTNKQGTLNSSMTPAATFCACSRTTELEPSTTKIPKIFRRSPTPHRRRFRMSFSWGYTTPRKSAGFNPLVMWDIHHLRAIDDSGYIDKLYR